MWFIDTHMHVTLEKIAVFDPVFDTLDAVGAYEEVGDPVPGEAKILVRMHASLLWIVYLYTICVYTCTNGLCNISICMRM